MYVHANAKLGPDGLQKLVVSVDRCASHGRKAAARRFGVSATTARRWSQRWQLASLSDRALLRCSSAKIASSWPHHSPRLLAGGLA